MLYVPMQHKKSTKYDCFANENRVHLLVCLEKKKCVTDLLSMCHLSQSALSQHLKILKDADFVTCDRDGQKQIYAVKNKNALRIAKSILSLEK